MFTLDEMEEMHEHIFPHITGFTGTMVPKPITDPVLFMKGLAEALARPDTYPYYRMSTYEICDSPGYEILCGMFLKYYAEKVPVCIAFSSNQKDLIAIWLMGVESYDPKTKQIPNSEPMGEILWRSGWPDTDNKEVD